MRDLHNNINVIRSISPVAVGTTGTGKTGTVIDLQGVRGRRVHLRLRHDHRHRRDLHGYRP